MIVLAIDTAGPACCVALYDASRRHVLASAAEPMARGHAEAVMPMVRSVVGDGPEAFARVGRIAVNAGPGSFTGVRIGVAAARGLGLACGAPVVGVTGFEVLADLRVRACPEGPPFAVAFDARRGQVYLQAFAGDGTALTDPVAVGVDDVPAVLPSAVAVATGSGATLMSGPGPLRVVATPSHDAAALARLAAGRDPGVPPVPLYLRAPDAKPQAPRLQGLPA